MCVVFFIFLGILFWMKLVYRKVENGRLYVINIKMGVYWLVGICRVLIICMIGISIICVGIMSLDKKNRYINLFNLVFKCVIGYEVMVVNRIMKMIDMFVNIMLFYSVLGKCICLKVDL